MTTLTWDAPAHDGSAPVQYYEVRVVRPGERQTILVPASQTSVEIEGSGKVYVTAINSRGRSPQSNVVELEA